ncbi:TraI/MobA(P) family conjugative relaxase [Xenorhabdus bovienii]|uniref:TraI/MobA(P) family conjugative relaxase n=1 Tax=Xenorhabdus bovienii TaxID=40576 RepID=UPI002A640707|nr:relaxase/mobilization nuclease domain-containing protein [Xenorhabdus bovienii]
MIAKRVARNKGTSSFARLVRYMVAAHGGLDPNSWARTVDYILDTKEKTMQGERVGSYRVTNCGTDDPAAATVLIEATQAANTRSKTDKTYHLVFSFPTGEHPPLDVLHAIEDELCVSIGYADHHRVSAVHTDTDHLHVHVAINKVHPTGFQNIEPYYDKKRLMEACERLEIKYGLQRTSHGLQKDKDHDQTDQIRLTAEPRPEQRDSRFRQYLRESYDLSLAAPPKTETFNGLRRQGHGHRADVGDERKIKASTVDIEVQSGLETLTGYVTREVAPLLRKAMSWKEIHSKAAEHGLEVNRRGAGLVIGDPGLSLWTKASTCGRDLSFKALTDRLGAFEPSRQDKERPAKSYTPTPRQDNPASAALFARYRHERQENIMARRDGLAQIKRDNERFKAQLQQWRNTQRMVLKVSARGATRKVMQNIIKRQADASRAAYRKVMDGRRHMLFVQTSMPAWADWLIVQAERGEPDALAVLRSREKRERRWHGDLLTAALADKAKTVVMKSLNPQARKDGTMVYRIVDGGIVIDRTTHVQAQKTTTGAALVMLELAAQKFEGHALIVEGTAGFRQVVAQLAGLHDLDIRFADPAMEQARQTAVDMKNMELRWPAAINPGKHPSIDRTKSGKDTASPAGSSGTVEKWIEERNKKRDNISSIDYHRFWTPGDVGKAIYQGRRRMADGTEVLLLKRGCEILVKPSSSYVVAKAAKWKRGRCVQLDAHGRFIGGGNGVEL